MLGKYVLISLEMDNVEVLGFCLTWINIRGVPLQFWNNECFTKILNIIGSLVSVDKQTSSFVNLDRARILVRTMWMEFINQHRRIQINKKVCNIMVLEENGGWEEPICCYRRVILK